MATATTEIVPDQSAVFGALAGGHRTAKVIADSLGAKLPLVLDELYVLRSEGRVRRRVNGRAVAHWERGKSE